MTTYAEIEKDLRERFRPSEASILDAQESLLAEGAEVAYAAIVLPGKDSGVWTMGQEVQSLPSCFASRSDAIAAALYVLGSRKGTVAFATIYEDGEWAVFEY